MRSLGWIALAFWIASCATSPRQSAEFAATFDGVKALSPARAAVLLDPWCNKGKSGACALMGRAQAARHQIPILQSVTSEHQSRFVTVVPRDQRLFYFLRSEKGDVRALPSERIARDHSSKAVDQIEAFDLNIREDYELLVVGPDGELWDNRMFKSLDQNKVRPRWAVISCMDDQEMGSAEVMWRQVVEKSPDVMFFLGDNVYADHIGGRHLDSTPQSIWDRYVDTREALPIFRSPKLIPTLAIWDDHDYGRNDGDRTFPHKEQSMEIFFAFFSQKRPAPGFERGPGVSSWWSAFRVHFGFLDDRYDRSPNKLDTPDQTHFGEAQEKWLNSRLLAAREPVFLVSGDQFFGGYHRFESYEGSHPKSFSNQLREWRKSKVPLLFVSGDRHLAEIVKVPQTALGYPTYEITSSGIHAKTFPDAFKNDPNPNQLIGVAGRLNFSIMELMRAAKSTLQVSVQAFDQDEKLLYQKPLTVKTP